MLDADRRRTRCEPSELIWRGWADERRVAARSRWLSGASSRETFGAPYFGIHRADLQRVLGAAHGAGALASRPPARRTRATSGDGVRLAIRQRTQRRGRRADRRRRGALDGARASSPAKSARLTPGTSAFRGIVPVRDLPSLPDPRALQFWMGPGATCCTTRSAPTATHVNFFAVVEGPARWTHETWTAPTRVRGCGARPSPVGTRPSSRWSTAVPHRVLWGLFTVRPLRTLAARPHRADRRRGARDAAAPWTGSERHDRGRDHAGRAPSRGRHGRLRCGDGGIRGAAPGPHAHHSAQCAGDERRAALARRRQRRPLGFPRALPRALWLDSRVRRAGRRRAIEPARFVSSRAARRRAAPRRPAAPARHRSSSRRARPRARRG